MSEAHLSLGDKVHWCDVAGKPYLAGTVVTFEPERRLTFALHDRSWSRPAAPGEVVWDFALTAQPEGTRLDYSLGDLAIDDDAEGWLAAYASADEPARLAALLTGSRP
jgi:hypothetical protein